MKSIPVDEVVRLAEYFVGLDWPLSREQGYAACEALGWPGTSDRGLFVTPYGLKHLDKASVIVARGGDDVTQVKFWLTDVVRDFSAERDDFMNDFFSLCVQEFRGLWGKGKVKLSKEDQEAQWGTLNGCHIILRNGWKAVNFRLYSPYYTAVLRSLGDL
ncbi:hypothetical protein EII34_15660 [Arachnia propionica]|uniref:Uncharacterized protein n=1 Tax=Arachnia propionica TaxID=1750 RepID=A0A3P1SZZ5_9ACTN|nr:DUF6301 family protein [Arachnia propionica]RRD02832.1 hypothetical protein EII34_15660 [Arachnia propionica]